MNASCLTRRDVAWLKGLAIILIFMHNFCHWLPRCVPENEYTFHIGNTWRLIRYLEQGGPHLLLNLFSYFGHYGVPVFVFLSGYGLVRKYESPGSPPIELGPFMKHNALKLWKLMLGGIILFILSDTYRHGEWIHGWDDVLWLLTFVSNLLPHRDLLLGPWWFFSLIMQLYLCYHLCFCGRGRRALLWAVLTCLALQAVAASLTVDPRQETLSYLRYNLVGSMLPFAAGIWTARYGLPLPSGSTILSLILLAAGCFNVYLWLLTPLFAVTAIIPLARTKIPALRTAGEWTGHISAALFVLHPVLRPYFADWARHGSIYPATASYIAVCLVAAWAYQALINRWKTA